MEDIFFGINYGCVDGDIENSRKLEVSAYGQGQKQNKNIRGESDTGVSLVYARKCEYIPLAWVTIVNQIWKDKIYKLGKVDEIPNYN